MNKEFYATKWRCDNCRVGYPYGEEEIIPKGRTIGQHFKSTECPRCGCKGTRYSYGGIRELNEKECEEFLTPPNMRG